MLQCNAELSLLQSLHHFVRCPMVFLSWGSLVLYWFSVFIVIPASMFPTSEDLTFKNAEWKPVIADTWFFVRHLSKIIASFISGDKIGQNQNQEYLGISSHTLSLLAGERVDIGHHLWPQDPLRLRQEGSPPVKGPQYAELLVSTLLTWLTLTVDEEMQDTGTDNSGEKDDRDY